MIQNIEGRIDTYEEYGLNTTIPLTVSRSVGFFGPITVTWQAEPREATILDFSPSSGTLSMADTQQSANIYITIIDDDVAENMEVSAQNFCFYIVSKTAVLSKMCKWVANATHLHA